MLVLMDGGTEWCVFMGCRFEVESKEERKEKEIEEG